jgi:hypothetical protein
VLILQQLIEDNFLQGANVSSISDLRESKKVDRFVATLNSRFLVDHQISNKTKYNGIQSLDESYSTYKKLIEKQKEQASGIYYRFIERVGELALKYPEEERAEYVIDWHTLFVSDFDEMSIPQLYQEYEGRFIGVNVLPKPVVDVLFAEALPLISNWAPKRLYQDLLETRQDLGTISKEQFIAWENAVTKKIENPAEREAQRKETMRAILSIAVYRVATQSTRGAPKPTQQNVLSSFLMTKEENPYAEEFSIAEDAGLLDFATLYHQHAGGEK